MKKFAMFLLVLGLLPGCMHEDKKSDAVGAEGDLVGTWMKAQCKLDVTTGKYSKLELKFEQSAFTSTKHIYSDSNCITMVGMGGTISGTYKTGNSITTPSGNKATEIDATNSAADGGATYLDIYAIIDNKLYFGVDDNNPATRPTALDFNSYFVKR